MADEVRFTQVKDGVPYTIDAGTHHEQCCDCGLIHKIKYVPVDSSGKPIRGARLKITAWRTAKMTSTVRKRQNLKVVKGKVIA